MQILTDKMVRLLHQHVTMKDIVFAKSAPVITIDVPQSRSVMNLAFSSQQWKKITLRIKFNAKAGENNSLMFHWTMALI